MRISEIFRSIQGESSFAGLPCTFVRTAGCSLRCAYCDTGYALDKRSGEEMSLTAVLDRACALGVD
ncbi:MAG TPA: 7-carboxy-7-deazaguanine synthase, partial [bacterium]|nr:7-carboxy-7-deazaguanine synthase [bacterium]